MKHEEKLEEFIVRLKSLFTEFEISAQAGEDEDGEFEFSLYYDKHDVYIAGIRSIRMVGGKLEIVLQHVQNLEDKGINE